MYVRTYVRTFVRACVYVCTGMNLSGIASQFAMQNRSFAMRKWMWFAENCDAKRFWPRKNNVIWVWFPCLHECMCKRGFGSPWIGIPHPKTLADLDDPKRGFGAPADLDPSITLYAIASRMMTSNVGSQIRGHLSADLAPPVDLDPDSQKIVEDLFRQVSMSLAHSDWQITFGEVITSSLF